MAQSSHSRKKYRINNLEWLSLNKIIMLTYIVVYKIMLSCNYFDVPTFTLLHLNILFKNSHSYAREKQIYSASPLKSREGEKVQLLY
jgi:hypothetical protein